MTGRVVGATTALDRRDEMFIQPDEHILLFENSSRRTFTIDELKSLVDAGTRTMLRFQYGSDIEPTMGVYDWTQFDEVVDRCQKAGMKLIVQAPASPPRCYPVEWYAKCENGLVKNDRAAPTLSFWNKDAMDRMDALIEMICKRYNSETVLVVSSLNWEGECIYMPSSEKPFEFPVFDDSARQSYSQFTGVPNSRPNIGNAATLDWLYRKFTETMVRTQKIYAANSKHQELWMQLHWAFANSPQTGCRDIPAMYLAVKEETGCDVNHIFFTGYDFPLDTPLSFQKRAGMKLWLGACWCEGLRLNTPSAVANKFRGLVCAPIHEYLKYERLEPWMLETFRWSNKQWGQNV